MAEGIVQVNLKPNMWFVSSMKTNLCFLKLSDIKIHVARSRRFLQACAPAMRSTTWIHGVVALKASNFRPLKRTPTVGHTNPPKGRTRRSDKNYGCVLNFRLSQRLCQRRPVGSTAAPQLSLIVLRERGVGGRFQAISFFFCTSFYDLTPAHFLREWQGREFHLSGLD